MTDMQPEPELDEVIDDQARDTVTVGELARQAGESATEPVPLEEV